MKFLLFITLLFVGIALFAGNAVDEMLAAYGGLNFPKARRLAQKIPDNPKARLVIALCQVFDPARQDIKGGLDSLKKLYDDKKLPLDVWCQAALTYGRVAQLVQERKELYKDLGADVNPHSVFQKIMDKAPESRAACAALFFDLSDDFESNDSKRIDKSFVQLEKFCREFKGKPEYLTPLHLLADQKYIYTKGDYCAAVGHLKKACRIGVANPKDAEIVLYRIGRIYDLKLKDKARAEKYYREFIKKHPESGYAPAVKRFLEALQRKNRKVKNAQK